MLEQDEQRDELLEKIEDLISRKRYAELRDLLLPLEAPDIAHLCVDLDEQCCPWCSGCCPRSRRRRCSWSWTATSRSC